MVVVVLEALADGCLMDSDAHSDGSQSLWSPEEGEESPEKRLAGASWRVSQSQVGSSQKATSENTWHRSQTFKEVISHQGTSNIL